MKPVEHNPATTNKPASSQHLPFESTWWDKITPILVRWRYLVFLGSLVLMFVVELIEHVLITYYSDRVHIYFDAIFFALMMPVGTWIMLVLLERTENARIQAVKEFDQGSVFNQELGEATNWEDLITRIVRFPGTVVNRSSTTLYVLNQSTSLMEAQATCGPDGEVVLHPVVNISPDSLPVGSLPQLLLQNGQGLFYDPANPDPRLPPHRYDLSITRNDHQIGVIKLQFPEDHAPSAEELRLLKNAVPTIAMALEGAILQNAAADQTANSELQRQQIAQNLHDTLAQNVGYLRLKLDQLTGENAIREIGVVLQELERMRATADEAYQQVRTTIDQLNPVQQDDLVTMVTKQADIISRRAGIRLRTNQVGMAFTLSPTARQQILYIAREALHNIEKHACAHQITVQYIWLTGELILKITDDGIGFDPRQISNDGHYGLWIMQHRAQEIGGTLKIAPIENGKGTEVTLWMPKNTHPMPGAR